VLLRTWRLSPHPEWRPCSLRPAGDSPRDRLTRVRHLGTPDAASQRSCIAIAIASIEAHDVGRRQGVGALLGARLHTRILTLIGASRASRW
jgi:HemY protein